MVLLLVRRYRGGMFAGWDSVDFLGWGLLLAVLLVAAAAVTYLVRAATGGRQRRRAERAELEQLRAAARGDGPR